MLEILSRWQPLDALLAADQLHVPRFAAEWNVSDRTVYRDIETLRESGQRIGWARDFVPSGTRRVMWSTPSRAGGISGF